MSEQAHRLLSVEEILATADLPEEIVAVPEWHGDVKIKAFMLCTRQEVMAAARVAGEISLERLTLLLFIHGVIEPRFTEEQYELLRRKNSAAIERVVRAINQINGIDEEALGAAKDRFPGRS